MEEAGRFTDPGSFNDLLALCLSGRSRAAPVSRARSLLMWYLVLAVVAGDHRRRLLELGLLQPRPGGGRPAPLPRGSSRRLPCRYLQLSSDRRPERIWSETSFHQSSLQRSLSVSSMTLWKSSHISVLPSSPYGSLTCPEGACSPGSRSRWSGIRLKDTKPPIYAYASSEAAALALKEARQKTYSRTQPYYFRPLCAL